MSDPAAKASQLFDDSLAFLEGPAVPPVLRAYDELGVDVGRLADALDLDPDIVAAWRCGSASIPDECRIGLLAHLSVLLMWLFGAESLRRTPVSTFWRDRVTAARHILEAEMRAAPALARRVAVLANEIDATQRQTAMRLVNAQRTGEPPSARPTKEPAPAVAGVPAASSAA